MEDERSIADPFRRLDAQYFPDNQLGDETLYPPSPAMTVSWAQQTNTVFFYLSIIICTGNGFPPNIINS